MSGRGAAFAAEYYQDADLRLIQLVPAGTRRILDVRCGLGYRGEVLKHVHPDRFVIGLNANPAEASAASARIDQVLPYEIASGLPENVLAEHAASIDCILVDDLLTRLPDPLGTLEGLRRLLKPDGTLIASAPNSQHWTVVDALYCGDLQTSDAGLLATANRHDFGFANLIKLFLDAGYLPRIGDKRTSHAPAGWHEAAAPLAHFNGLYLPSFVARTETYQYFIAATPIAGLPVDEHTPSVTVGVCTNDARVLRDNLLASPCLASNGHELLIIEGAASAAEGLNAVIEQARHELVVLAHQDVYLPKWWIARLCQQYRSAAANGGKVGIMGVYGVTGTPTGIFRAGRVADREFLLDEPAPLPVAVGSLDELVLIVPKSSPVRFDPTVGYHLYGTDACLTAASAGCQAFVIDAPCFHNSKQGDVLPEAFHRASVEIARKWPRYLPIATPCSIIVHPENPN